MNPRHLLGVRDLRLQAGERLLATGLCFDVHAGELWALLGPNGSGKTTLLNALAGLHPPAAGDVMLAGRPLAAWPAGDAACLRGLLPQTLQDAFSASVLDVVLIGRHPHLARWAWEDDDDRRIAQAALDAVDLAGFADHDVLTLSGGERQRVGLAAVLAQDPLLLLLDEPLAHLDLHHQIGLLQHLQHLARTQGKAIVMALHDLNLAQRFASHALVLRADGHTAGATRDVMTPDVLGAAYGHPLQRVDAAGQTLWVPA